MTVFCWWLFYSIAASYAQFFFVSYDFFIPGLILCLQNRNWKLTLPLLLVWIIISEGYSRLIFGSVCLSYLGVIVFFFVGSWLFEEKNSFFVFFLAMACAIWQWGVLWGMARLQGFHFPSSLHIIITQFLITLVGWLLSSSFYRRIAHGKN